MSKGERITRVYFNETELLYLKGVMKKHLEQLPLSDAYYENDFDQQLKTCQSVVEALENRSWSYP